MSDINENSKLKYYRAINSLLNIKLKMSNRNQKSDANKYYLQQENQNKSNKPKPTAKEKVTSKEKDKHKSDKKESRKKVEEKPVIKKVPSKTKHDLRSSRTGYSIDEIPSNHKEEEDSSDSISKIDKQLVGRFKISQISSSSTESELSSDEELLSIDESYDNDDSYSSDDEKSKPVMNDKRTLKLNPKQLIQKIAVSTWTEENRYRCVSTNTDIPIVKSSKSTGISHDDTRSYKCKSHHHNTKIPVINNYEKSSDFFSETDNEILELLQELKSSEYYDRDIEILDCDNERNEDKCGNKAQTRDRNHCTIDENPVYIEDNIKQEIQTTQIYPSNENYESTRNECHCKHNCMNNYQESMANDKFFKNFNGYNYKIPNGTNITIPIYQSTEPKMSPSPFYSNYHYPYSTNYSPVNHFPPHMPSQIPQVAPPLANCYYDPNQLVRIRHPNPACQFNHSNIPKQINPNNNMYFDNFNYDFDNYCDLPTKPKLLKDKDILKSLNRNRKNRVGSPMNWDEIMHFLN